MPADLTPLPAVPDAELCARFRAGDPLAAAELVRRLERLVMHRARRVRLPPGLDVEDLAQVGFIAVVKAARSYDPASLPPGGRTATLVTWCNRPVKWAMLKLLDKHRRRYAAEADLPEPDGDGPAGFDGVDEADYRRRLDCRHATGRAAGRDYFGGRP